MGSTEPLDPSTIRTRAIEKRHDTLDGVLWLVQRSTAVPKSCAASKYPSAASDASAGKQLPGRTWKNRCGHGRRVTSRRLPRSSRRARRRMTVQVLGVAIEERELLVKDDADHLRRQRCSTTTQKPVSRIDSQSRVGASGGRYETIAKATSPGARSAVVPYRQEPCAAPSGSVKSLSEALFAADARR